MTVNQAAITELNTPPNFVENVGGDEVVLKRKRLHPAVTRWFLVAKSNLFPMNLDYAEIIAKIVIVSGMIILMLHLTKLLCKLLSNTESYYFPFWKVNDTIPTLMKSKGKLRMNKKNQTISKEEATAILKSVDSTKRDAIKSFRIPLLLVTLISLSWSLVVFSWGMTEHDNLWALGMYIGTASFGIFVAFYIYTFRLLGIKINILPRSKEKIKSELVLLLIFAVIFIFGRQFRVYEGFEYAPHIAALIAGGYMAYLLYKYPTGEYLQGISHND